MDTGSVRESDRGVQSGENLEIPGLDGEDVNSLLNVKSYEQYVQYVQDRQSGKCPFCDPLDTELNKVIQEIKHPAPDDAHWRMWVNPFPQKHTSSHLIIAPVRHVTRPNQMTSGDWSCYSSLVAWAISSPDGMGMGLEGGGVLMRWGDPIHNAGSIRHLHANVIVPDGTGEVRLPLAKDPLAVERKREILVAFEKMRRMSEKEPGLTPEQLSRTLDRTGQLLVKDRLE